MTKKKHAERVTLAAVADQLVTEIWEHKWDHIPEVKSVPLGLWIEIPQELERRCPGHLFQEYRDAICRNYINRR